MSIVENPFPQKKNYKIKTPRGHTGQYRTGLYELFSTEWKDVNEFMVKFVKATIPNQIIPRIEAFFYPLYKSLKTNPKGSTKSRSNSNPI